MYRLSSSKYIKGKHASRTILHASPCRFTSLASTTISTINSHLSFLLPVGFGTQDVEPTTFHEMFTVSIRSSPVNAKPCSQASLQHLIKSESMLVLLACHQNRGLHLIFYQCVRWGKIFLNFP